MSTRLEAYETAPELEGQVIYEPEWYLLSVPSEAHLTLLQLLAPLGVVVKPAVRPHISIIKNEAPCRNKVDWGVSFIGEHIKFPATAPSRGVRTACTFGSIATARGSARCGSTSAWSP
jgi:hypothetical protein